MERLSKLQGISDSEQQILVYARRSSTPNINYQTSDSLKNSKRKSLFDDKKIIREDSLLSTSKSKRTIKINEKHVEFVDETRRRSSLTNSDILGFDSSRKLENPLTPVSIYSKRSTTHLPLGSNSKRMFEYSSKNCNTGVNENPIAIKPLELSLLTHDSQNPNPVKIVSRNAIKIENPKLQNPQLVNFYSMAAKASIKNYLAELFTKKPEHRTSSDKEEILNRLKLFPFFEKSFQKMSSTIRDKQRAYDDFIMECSKYLLYEYFEAGQPIFHKGDYGKKMFLILDGECSVYIPKSVLELAKERDTFDDIRASFVFQDGFVEPDRKTAIQAANKFLPQYTCKGISEIKEKNFDPFLKLMITHHDRFSHFQVGEFHQAGLGDINMYYKQNAF